MSLEIHPSMVRKLDETAAKFAELDAAINDPGLFNDPEAARVKLKEHGRLKPMTEAWKAHKTLEARLAEAKGLVGGGDAELAELAQAELPELEAAIQKSIANLRDLFASDDAEADADVVVEISAGVGGDESALFAGDLYRMYTRYAERQGWKLDVVDVQDGNAGGFKRVAFTVEGSGVFKRLRFESGGHRVQRVPKTETQGRIHTSMATVVVLPQVEEVDVEIDKNDVRIDKYSAGGPGGQHVNKTQSAVRLTHIPTGLQVQCQDEKSQIKNLARAWKVMRARYADALREKAEKERGDARRSLRGRGNRNERIRTYNVPQDRITDHRIGITVHSVDRVLDGELDGLVEPLIAHDKEEALKAL
jgi:peptide chain release factor 1